MYLVGAVEKDKDACDMGTMVEEAAKEMRLAFNKQSLFKLDQSQGVQGHECHNRACKAGTIRTAVCCLAAAGRHCKSCGSEGEEKGCGYCASVCCTACCKNPSFALKLGFSPWQCKVPCLATRR